MKLTKTQLQVLKVLYEYKDEWLSEADIKKKSKEFINTAHISQALIKLNGSHLVYNPIIENGTYKFQITLDGEDAFLNS
ncbi:hypothetical protein [Paenibacillus thermotolerans]|uniref:hypothetical protein n=1 Tax=Paenibacillus thermotolerans TaxID=3027807 RepID=UPI002367D084|nr:MULTISPECIES: hypothetical protein [unclassified Paenibacillus]